MESLLIVFGQYLTEIRMCDLDSLFGPVSQGFPCLPFSNHLVHNRQPLSYVSPPFLLHDSSYLISRTPCPFLYPQPDYFPSDRKDFHALAQYSLNSERKKADPPFHLRRISFSLSLFLHMKFSACVSSTKTASFQEAPGPLLSVLFYNKKDP